jgi:exosortase
MKRHLARHNVVAALALALPALLFVPARKLAEFALSGDYYNLYILAIPALSALVIYVDRRRIFEDCSFSPAAGVPLALFGIALSWLAHNLTAATANTYGLSMSVLGAAVIEVGVFLICFGTQAVWRARFPLEFLLLAIPIPAFLMNQMIVGLQNGTAAFSLTLFRVLRVPTVREGLRFSLPGIDIEIMVPCSGIRSTIGLGIASILAGHLFIRTGWKKLFLAGLTIPVAMFKNAVRIVLMATLGVYVDRGYLHGALHTYGGLPVNLLELAILTPVLIAFHRSDARQSRSSSAAGSSYKTPRYPTSREVRAAGEAQ